MIEQQARVLARNGDHLLVEMGAVSGCSACDAGQGCGAGLFGKLLNRRPVTLELEADASSQPGQTVQVGLPESLFLKLVLSLYGVPLLAGLAGAAAALVLAAKLALGGAVADLLVLAGALLVAIPVLKIRNRTLTPEIGSDQIRIIRTTRPGAVCSGVGVQQINEVKK